MVDREIPLHHRRAFLGLLGASPVSAAALLFRASEDHGFQPWVKPQLNPRSENQRTTGYARGNLFPGEVSAQCEEEKIGFYVSDADTIHKLTPPRTLKPTGVFNGSKVWQPGEDIVVSFEAGAGSMDIVDWVPTQGVSLDVQIGIYEISSGEARFVNKILPFVYPFGGAENGMLMNAKATENRTGYFWRNPALPPLVGGKAPQEPGLYQVGSVLTFHSSHPFNAVVYDYYMNGWVR